MRQVRASLGLEQLTFKQIRYFQAIAEAGSFRRAADRLGVTQPTLTVQIATLESTLNTPLFERQRSGVVLTPVARDLLPRARRIAEEIKGFADQAQGVSGQSTIAWAYPTLGPYLLPRVLPAVHRHFENLRLYVREGIPAQLSTDLKSAAHDVILTTLPLQGEDLGGTLFRESSSWRCLWSIPAKKSVISAEDLVGEAVLTIDEQHLYHRQISALCASVRR